MSETKRIKCPHCGRTYDQGAPHQMFCEACTCERCMHTFSEPLITNENGVKLCEHCQDAEPDYEPEEENDQ